MSQYPDNRRSGPPRRADPSPQNPGSMDATLDPNAPLQSWGKWEQSRHYSLEVVQNPLRCRMAGFGDRDRRPLAPAVVAKMVVRNETSRILDVDEVEIDFFLVTCDLWSADGHQELNLVQNPSSVSKKKRPTEHPGSGHASADEAGESVQPPTGFPVTSSGMPGQPPEMGSSAFGKYPSPGAYPSAPPGWAPPYGSWDSANSTYPEAAPQGYGVYPNYVEPSGQRAAGSGAGTSSASSAQSPQSQQNSQVDYTRTLVGPLSANAARLKDHEGHPGIFFTFQDLSVRTEGTFRLRLRLMNVGTSFARPAPSHNTHQVHNATSPVLALTWTEPFTVYSAKKFPGVPPITDLSKAFASQGQKLPLRSRGGNRNRTKGGSDDDEGSEAGSGDDA